MEPGSGDQELIARARQGDLEAIHALYRRHAPRVYAIVRRLAGDDALADDWAQETWLRVVRALPSFRGEARFSTWIHRIAVNCALHGKRWRKRRESSELPLPAALPAEATPDAGLLRIRLERALDRIPEGMRRVIVLHDVEGYTHEEIGEMLGISPGTSKSQLFKARARMRELLRPAREPVNGEGAPVCHT
ncbi:MAG: sigma-70 family RNA polymerase sigma factor [Gemmatimonadetes bacterium]|nr:sigma-70 family RNA polymerase sigma factor [Gemmatimonadota bacterium]